MQQREFNLTPSKYYLIFLLSIFIYSSIIVFTLPISLFIKLISAVSLIIYGLYQIWVHGFLKGKHSILAICYFDDGRWLVHQAGADNEKVINNRIILRGDTYVTGFVSVLRFNVSGRRSPLSCVIFKDSLSPNLYRELLVCLRMAKKVLRH